MNASNRCASCSGADVSSMRGAGAVCVVLGCAGGAAGHAGSAVIMHSPLPSPPLPALAAPLPAGPAPGCLTLRGAREELGACGARSPVRGMDKPVGLLP